MPNGNHIFLPWDRRNFLPRVIAIGLMLAWVLWGLSIYNEGQRLQARIQERQQQQLRREDQRRREAAYQQRMMQEQNIRRSVKNAVDGFKR